MNTQNILSLLALVLLVIGGGWAVFKSLTARSNDVSQVNTADHEAIWRRVDDLKKDIIQLQVDQGVLKERVRSIPDQELLHARFEAMEEKLERKLKEVSIDLKSTITDLLGNFRDIRARETRQ